MASVLSQNFFQLMGLPESMQIDVAVLRSNYQALMKTVHPDLHVNATDREQAEAIRASAYVNDAWATLREPVKRAAYLLTLKGLEISEGVKSNIGGDFLMQQIELREKLEEYSEQADFISLEKLELQTDKHIASLEDRFSEEYEKPDLNEAGKTLDKLQFMSKFKRDIEAAIDKLEDTV